MPKKDTFDEADLAGIAKKFRLAAKKTRSQAARELEVSHASVFHAEESPEKSFSKLRMRMIEKYSTFKVKGPKYWLEGK